MTKRKAACSVLVLAMLSCGAPSQPTVGIPKPNAVQRFLSILQQKGPLFGLGADCGEWIGGAPVLDDSGAEASPDEDTDDGEVLDVGGEEPVSETYAWPKGHLRARNPDAEGRMFGFSFHVSKEGERVRLQVSGRGGWHPAPGVSFTDPRTGYGLIGTGRYCSEVLDVRAHRSEQDAVAVGDEIWFLSHNACVTYRATTLLALSGCARNPNSVPEGYKRTSISRTTSHTHGE